MSTNATKIDSIRPAGVVAAGPVGACLLCLLCLLAVTTSGGCAAATDKAVISQANQFQTSLAPAEVPDPQVNAYLDRIGKRIISAAVELDKQHVGPKAHFDQGQSEDWMFQN